MIDCKMIMFYIFTLLFSTPKIWGTEFDVKYLATRNVVDYGAIGDGKIDDTNAFLKAWDDICQAKENTIFLSVPSDKVFLVRQVQFNGPCKPTIINIQIIGTIIAPDNLSVWEDFNNTKWINFKHVRGLNIYGPGKINGRGEVWWAQHCKFQNSEESRKCWKPPNALSFNNCTGLLLSGLTHINSQRCHISITNSTGVKLTNLTIIAPGDSPNTDAIDISKSNNILLTDLIIGTGDDCVAINGGSYNINITNVKCGPGHGISVGSLGKQGTYDTVEEVHVKNCAFTNSFYGARIKTWQGGSGYARKISFRNLTFKSVKHPILIDQYYCNDNDNCKNDTKAVQVRDIIYNMIHGTSTEGEVIALNCSTTVPCTNIKMENINIRSESPEEGFSRCTNAHGTCNITFPHVSCLSSI